MSAFMTVRDEPDARLHRAVAALAAQTGIEQGLELVIAAPPAEARRIAELEPRGAVGRIVVVDNPTGRRSPGLNLAAGAASHAYLCRVDARSRLAPDHVARCVARLVDDANVGVAGGVQSPASMGGTTQRGVSRALANPWALGAPAYRRRSASGPVDTVYLGAFRRDELVALGGYDERLDANEDFDLCRRYAAAGYVVWLERGLVVSYEARTALSEVWAQYVSFGRSKVRYWRLTGGRPNGRQLAGMAIGAIGAIGALALLHRPRRLGAAVSAGIAALAVVDHVADPAERDPRVRIVSVASYPVIVGGWLSGVVVEAGRALLR